MGKEKKDLEKQETELKESNTNQEASLKQNKEKKQDKKKKKEKPKTEIEKLQERNKELEKQVSEEKSKYAFLQAELENTRKHYIKQQEWIKNRTKINTITSFTPLIDSFEMALNSKVKIVKNDDQNCQMDVFIDGFEKVYENLKTIFDKFGVKPIEETNISLDYRQHETIMKIINDDVPEDTILQIVAKGYKMNGEVIRPAKVVVSKKTPIILPPEPPEPEEISSKDNDKKQEKVEGKPTPFE